jgi:hypothetical protein
MEEINVDELAKIIDMAEDAVAKSVFGPVFTYPDQNNVLDKKINQLSFGVFTIVLSGLMKDIYKM